MADAKRVRPNDMVSERGSRTRTWLVYSEYTRDIHEWLFESLEITTAVGRERDRALLDSLEPQSAASKLVLPQLKAVRRLDEKACREELGGETASEETAVDDLRWQVLNKRLAALLPKDDLVAPEDQLRSMKRDVAKENLLVYVDRFVREARSFVAQQKVSMEKAVRILYHQMPEEIRRALIHTGKAGLSLIQIETLVRNKLEVLAMTDAGEYSYRQLVEYLDEATCRQKASGKPETARLELPLVGGETSQPSSGQHRRLDINNPNHVMIAWKRLMRVPRFRREAQKYLASNSFDARPATQLRALQTETEDVDDPLELELAEEDGDVLSKPGLYTMYKGYPLVCSRISPVEKASMNVPTCIEGTKISGLVDTGATACFIQEATVKALGIQQRVTQCGNLYVSLGNGSASPILGRINIEARIDDHPYEMEAFVIGGKGPPLILGFPFFATNQLLIDCQEKRIWRRNGEEITCTQAQLKVLNQTDVTHLLEEMQRLQTELDELKGQKNIQGASLNPAQWC